MKIDITRNVQRDVSIKAIAFIVSTAALAEGANVQIGPGITQVATSSHPIVSLGSGNNFGPGTTYGQMAIGEANSFSPDTLGLQIGSYNEMIGSCYGSLIMGMGNSIESDGTIVAGEGNQVINSNNTWLFSNFVMGSWNTIDSFQGSLVVGNGNSLEYGGTDPGTSGCPSAIVGQNNSSSSGASWILGMFNNVSGDVSTAVGIGLENHGATLVTLGGFNICPPGDRVVMRAQDPIFILGNGDYSQRSNAIETRRNGETVLINKAWKSLVSSNPSAALDDPTADSTDAGGNALVVEGHAVLKGKVILAEAQGDVSMGIYE